MTQRHNHYEAAFEAYLREHEIPYVAVDEAKRARLGGGSLKSLDFIVSPVGSASSEGSASSNASAARWLVDVKGRRFASGARGQSWKNWTTRDDLESLARWQALFGPPFVPLLVFAYEVVDEVSPLALDELFAFRRRLYAMVAIRLEHYASAARVISPKWQTLAMPAGRFRELARPLSELVTATPAASADGKSLRGVASGHTMMQRKVN